MIEDDERLAGMVSDYLGASGYVVHHAPDAGAGLDHLQHASPELVILDLMLPDMDGLQVCQRIRALPGAAGQVPVLMLTAKGDPMDRIIGLEMGADDYLPKPFEPRELLARIRAILRRKGAGAASVVQSMQFGSLEIDRDARRITVRGQARELTWPWPNGRVACSRATRSWRPFAGANSRPLTDPSTCTWAASVPPLKTT